MDKCEELVVNNVGLVYNALHKFKLAYNADAESMAYEGLFKAAVTYSESSSTKFSTYATCVINNELRMYLRTSSAKKNQPPLSMDTAVPSNLNEEAGATLLDMLHGADSLDEGIINKELRTAIFTSLNGTREELSKPLHIAIFDTWFDSDFTATQSDIASITGASRALVNRIINRARNRLKKELEGYL